MLFLDRGSGFEHADSYTLWSLNLLSLRLEAAEVLNLGNELLGLEMYLYSVSTSVSALS